MARSRSGRSRAERRAAASRSKSGAAARQAMPKGGMPASRMFAKNVASFYGGQSKRNRAKAPLVSPEQLVFLVREKRYDDLRRALGDVPIELFTRECAIVRKDDDGKAIAVGARFDVDEYVEQTCPKDMDPLDYRDHALSILEGKRAQIPMPERDLLFAEPTNGWELLDLTADVPDDEVRWRGDSPIRFAMIQRDLLIGLFVEGESDGSAEESPESNGIENDAVESGAGPDSDEEKPASALLAGANLSDMSYVWATVEHDEDDGTHVITDDFLDVALSLREYMARNIPHVAMGILASLSGRFCSRGEGAYLQGVGSPLIPDRAHNGSVYLFPVRVMESSEWSPYSIGDETEFYLGFDAVKCAFFAVDEETKDKIMALGGESGRDLPVDASDAGGRKWDVWDMIDPQYQRDWVAKYDSDAPFALYSAQQTIMTFIVRFLARFCGEDIWRWLSFVDMKEGSSHDNFRRAAMEEEAVPFFLDVIAAREDSAFANRGWARGQGAPVAKRYPMFFFGDDDLREDVDWSAFVVHKTNR